jgi:outer membrane receptor protein involved in Fe transport
MLKNAALVLLVSSQMLCLSVFSQDTVSVKSAQELLNLSLDDFLNVVITPSKLPQANGSITQKVDVIADKELESIVSGNRNICEAISKLPGVSVTVLSRNDANWGTYGGIGPKYSTYMLQGLPVDAFIDPMSLDLNAIERIEVQRGPASIIYPNYMSHDFAGSQTPLGGTVNLILKGKIEEKETKFGLSYGSYNTLNGQLFHQNHSGDLNYFIGTTYEISDYTNYGTTDSWLNMHKNPEYRKLKMFGGVTLLLNGNEKQKISLFFNQTLHSGDAGRIYRGYNNEYGTLNAGYDFAINSSLFLQSHIGIRSYDRSWQESNFGVVDTLKSENGVNQIIIPADISLAWKQTENLTLSFGADLQDANYLTWYDPLTGYHNTQNKASTIQVGIYGQEEWQLSDKFMMRGGLRYAYISDFVVLVNGGPPGNDKVSWTKLLWSAGSRYSVNSKISLFANAGTSFASPGLKSSCGTLSQNDFGIPGRNGQLPNPDLRPESGTGTDAGIDLKLTSHLKLGTRFFFSKVKDAIVDNVVSQNPSQTKSVNAGSSVSTGGEAELLHRISNTFSWYLNYTCIYTNTRNDLHPDQNDVSIPFSPKNVINLGFDLNTSSGLNFVPSVNYNSGFFDGIDRFSRKWYTPGMVLDAYIAQKISGNQTYAIDLFVQLSNILNNDYELPWQFMNPGFSGMCGIRILFK